MQPLTVHRYGSPAAPPLVLVHGLTDAGTAWPDLVQHWGDRWDVHAPDLRGNGRSPRFTTEELAAPPDVLLDDVVGLVEALPAPAVLVGHSLGGLLALRAALARPDRVTALVLEDPARPSGDVPDPAFVAAQERFLDSLTDLPASVRRMVAESGWSRAEAEAWAACKPLVDRAYVRQGLWLGDPAWEELFDALRVPTLLVVPPDAPMAPAVVGNDRVRRVVVPRAGHCVRRDQPDLFHEAVDAFLAEVAPAAA
ncbi:alpha/beta fold hydrolase [Cellulomonas telluris]|uniref:alpha/beta fold hydrolase n=1 Tax=Cellulomonas telluris TaxID=2306636 RepID=UPI001FE7F391|nr:alpha/beta hydrolase [Cellulomonas telluris]